MYNNKKVLIKFGQKYFKIFLNSILTIISFLRAFEGLKNKLITVNFRKKNGHISLSSNSALDMATGEWIALLDHDDELSYDALFRVVSTINENPDAALIYSDEDKINSAGRHEDPYFKCNWNYDLFLSQNMISHLGVYKTSIVKQIGGFRGNYEGSQDYDLALRFIDEISHDQIVHIPYVLYHWRIHKQSTAKIVGNKPYALSAAKKAIEDHLARNSVDATVHILPEINMYRVKYKLGKYQPSVSIIIPSKNNNALLKNCIDSILIKTKYSNYEIIIVDNGSDDAETLKFLDKISRNEKVKILQYNNKFNYSDINNTAASECENEYLCFLNDDTEVITDDWLEEMVSIGIQDGVGIVGAKLKYPDNTLQHGGIILGIGGVGSHSHKGIPESTNGYFNRAGLIQSVSAVTGASLLINRKLFNEVKGFNTKELPIAYNDIDLCLRVKEQGFRVVYTPFAELYHYESSSRGTDTSGANLIRLENESSYMYQKWEKIIDNDPAYSPNLTLTSDSFSLAWPPRVSKFN